MRIQSNLGSTIAMAFDECVENPAEYAYVGGLLRADDALAPPLQKEHEKLNARSDAVNPPAAAVRHQSGRHLRRSAPAAHAGHPCARIGRLRHRRAGGGESAEGDVPHHRVWNRKCPRTNPGI